MMELQMLYVSFYHSGMGFSFSLQTLVVICLVWALRLTPRSLRRVGLMGLCF